MNTPSLTTSSCQLPQGGSLKRNKNFLLFPRPRRHKSSAQNIITPRGAHRFSSILSIRFYLRVAVRSAAPPHLFSSIFSLLSYLKKIPAGAGIFIAFILPNKRQIRRQSEQQRRLQSPMRRYRRARGECLSGRRPRRTCPSAYVREFSRFSESASRRRS